MSNQPVTLDAHALAKLLAPILYKSQETILRNIARAPDSLPPFVILGGKKLWFVQTVQEWLAGGACGESKQIVIVLDLKSSTASANCPPAIPSFAEMMLASAGR